MNPPVQSGERKQLKESWRCADCIQAADFGETLEQRIKQCDQIIPIQKLDNDGTKAEERFVRTHPTEAELIAGRVEAMRLKLGDRVTADDLDVFREVLRMRCKLEQEDLKRTPEAIRLGRHEIETWYSSPFPREYAKLKVLYMCEFCLKYMKTNGELDHHQRKCSLRHPPGWEIYRDGERSVFEVDGNDQKLYCQSLCLLAKLFLDHKTLYFDVEPFLFYILTVRDHLGHHVVGYFSKEKYNQLRYNVSCILTMPQYQRQGYGRFLIEFSYLLSRVEGKPGTPERPLSDLGRVSYQQYWCSALLAYFYLNRNDTLTLEKVSRETGMIVGDIVEALRKLGFIRYRVERAGCIRTKRPFICVHWQRVEQHQQRVVSARKRIELREMCLLWIPNMRLSIAMKQFMHGLSRKPIEDISPMEPSERPMLPSSPTPPYAIEDISLDSVEAFMGTPKSELQKSPPEKHLGGPGFTPIAPFRRQDDGDSGTATGDEACGRFGTPKTTRRHHPVMGNGTRRRKRVVLPSEEINPKRLRLDIMARGTEVDEMCLKEAVHHSILQLDKESVKCFVPGRSTGRGRASLDEYSVKPNKLLALFGRPLPRTV
uniref:histone acetyltransferase n=1 Tax=Anopheles minimus TaxID=112268 RepID=A0A182VRY8_9DIPT